MTPTEQVFWNAGQVGDTRRVQRALQRLENPVNNWWHITKCLLCALSAAAANDWCETVEFIVPHLASRVLRTYGRHDMAPAFLCAAKWGSARVIAFLLGSELFRKMARHYYGSLLPDGDNDDGTGEPIIRNSQCVTALSYACERGHVGTVQVIVQSVRHRRLAGWLEDEDMDDDRPLDCAVVRGHVDVAAVLVRANASLDLDFERSTGSVLARAVHGGHVAAVQFLLDAKAVLCDAKAAVHGTHAWSGCQDRRIVRLLVRAKADVRSFACCRPVTAAAKHGTHDDRNEDV